MTDPVPEVPLAAAARSRWDRVSIVWLVPLIALAVALAVAWQTWAERGPLIEIAFDDAEGVAAGETELRFRDVAVGLVEEVRFTEDLGQVVVTVRLDPEMSAYVDVDARFWVVEPSVTPQGISGIETVLSGVFIEGLWDATPGEAADRFQGLDTPPLLTGPAGGLNFILRSSTGALTSEMPLLFKGVSVGQVGPPRVSADGFTVEADAVVFAPYDALITRSTRFWDASGFRLTVDAGGADVDFDSLSSLIVGGLTFETFAADAEAAQDGDVFVAYYSEDLARESAYADPDAGPALNLTATFAGEVASLAEGAAVELDGLRIGEVAAVQGRIDPADGRVRVEAVLAIQPARLALEGGSGPDEVLRFLDAQVADGLRARLATGSLLGNLEVQLVPVADAPPAAIDRDAAPYPSLPTTENDIADVAASAQGAIERIDALPIEELLGSAISFMDAAAVLVGSAETQAIPGEVGALLGDVRGLVAAPEVRALPAQVAATLAEVDGAVGDVRALLASLEEAQAVERLLAATDRAGAAAERIGAATEGVPVLVERLAAVAAKAEALEVEALLAEVQGLSAEARALLAQPGLQALPAELGSLSREATATLAEARRVVAEIDAGEVGPRLAAALAAAEEAAVAVEASVAGVPALVGRLDALAATANELPVEALVGELTSLATSADALVSAPETQALTRNLSSALAEAEALLREAREGGVVANANATLAAARQAAESLPALVERANGLLDRASATIAGFDETSTVVRDAREAMQEVAAAADAVAQLARTIERDPNALLFGR